MKKNRITGLIALALCAVLAFSGAGYAEEFGWPTPGITGLSTIYYYSDGTAHKCKYHTSDGKAAGIDILAPSNTEVLAPASGTVKTVLDLTVTHGPKYSFGRYIEIQHDNGTITLYAHLNEFRVSEGQRVNGGDVIALSGSTGNSSGPHLHYEMSNIDTYRYYETNGYNDPRNPPYRKGENPDPYREDPPKFSQSLRNLTSSKYAKIYTLSSGRYYNLFSNKELTSRLSSSHWTGENDEVWLLDVGVNSSNVVYAHISYPTSSKRIEAYARLRELFVKGTENSGVITAKNNVYGLYKRLNSGQNWSYGIDAGDECYLLTKENGWYQVMYPITGQKYCRIAWMSEGQYTTAFPSNGVTPPTITSLGNIPGSVVAGSYSSYNLTASGKTSITWKAYNGTPTSSASNYLIGLPPGMSISSSGTSSGAKTTISGYPSHTSLGQSSRMPLYYFFKVKATNSGGSSAAKSSYIVVYEPPVFETSETLAKGDVNKYYSQTIKAKGTEYSMRWKIIEGKLPPGLTFKGNSSTRTATISGYPTRTGYYRFKVQLYNLVGNSNTTTTKWFNIAIGNVATEWKDSRLPFTYTFKNASTGKNYSDWVGIKDTSSGTKYLDNYIFLVSEGSLPPGLYIDEKSSSIYTAGMVYLKGVPSTAGTYNFTIKAKRISDGGYNTKNFTIKVTSSTASVWKNNSMSTTYNFLPGKMRVTYRDYIRVNGGSAPYTPSVVGGELPPGMRLEQNGVYTYLTGVPKQNGSFTFKLRITGSNGGYVEKDCTVTIANNSLFKSGGSTKDSKPKFTSKALPDAYVGSMWEATLDTYGTEPIAYYAEEPLPEWLTLDEETGTLSGIPMEKGKYKLRIRAENELGSATKTFKVKVVLSSPAILTSELPEGYTGVPYETRLEASGTDPIKWSKIGKLPGGLKLDKTLGIISGTPKKEGSFDFSIKAKNKAGTETVQLRIVIRKSADEPTEKDESGEEYDNDDEDDEDDTEEPADKTSSENSSSNEETGTQDVTLPAVNGYASLFTKLYAVIGGENLEGSVNAEAGKPLAFEIGGWVDEYGRDVEASEAKIFVNDENISADISDDGTFTLPAEIVSGEMTVYVSAQTEGREIRTLEIDAVTFGQGENDSASSSGSENSEENSAGGCNFGLLGMLGLTVCVKSFLIKKR